MKAWENRGMVFSVAQKYFPECHDHDEYLIDGLKGLCLAIERHDPARGKLSTFATPHIRNLIGRARMNQSFPVHVPAYARESIDFNFGPVIRESETWSWERFAVEEDCEPDPASIKTSEIIDDALSTLSPRRAEIIRRRYGIGPGQYEQEPGEIAREMGIAVSSVSFGATEGMKQIKEYIEQRGAS